MTRAGIAFLLLFGMASCVAFVSHQHSIHIARSRSTCGGLARTAILCAMDLRQKNLRRRSTGKSFERPSLIQLRQYGITRERCNTSIPTQSMHTIAGKPSTLEQGSSYATLSNENTQSLLRNNVNVSISIIGDAFVDLLCFLNNGQNNTGISGDTHLPVEVGGDTLLERPIVPMPGGSGINTATHLRYILDEYGQSEVDVEVQTALNQNDEYGRILMNHASRVGFTMKNRAAPQIGQPKHSTGHCVVVISNGERSFLTHRGCIGAYSANDVDVHSLVGKKTHDLVEEGDINSPYKQLSIHHQHIHIAGYYSIPNFWGGKLRETLEYIRNERTRRSNEVSYRTTVSLVPQYDASKQWDGQLLDLLDCVDFLICSESEARSITRCTSQDSLDVVASAMKSASAETIAIVTRSSGGAVALRDGKVSHVQNAGIVDAAVDPTGAGDAFAAGFLYGILNCPFPGKNARFSSDQQDDLKNDSSVALGLRWGCAVGTASILRPGATSPSSKEEIDQFLM